MPSGEPYKALIIAGYEDLTDEDVAAFWEQGVSMDDWDVMVLIEGPDDVLDAWDDRSDDPSEVDTISYTPKLYVIERMVDGRYETRWHKAEFRGRRYAVGVAYHS